MTKQWVGNVAGSGKSKELSGWLRAFMMLLMLARRLAMLVMGGCLVRGGDLKVWFRRDAMH